ncbi:MAG: M20/M25/M40 family metallo-hydrolase [Armatimonadetes bacterium]|nr:M20/M25/M40 family metallo-hydrolase [Armatimonadota bacterium]
MMEPMKIAPRLHSLPPLDPPGTVNRNRLVQNFLDLIQVDGPTRAERQVADTIKEQLRSMRLEAQEDDAGRKIGGNTGNLLVKVPANVEGAPRLLFAAHMDTVPLATGVQPTIGDDGVIRSDGTTALGGDNRAGCAEILEAVREILEENAPHGELQLLFTVGEEGGLLGARALDPARIQADLGFVVDVLKPHQIYTQGSHLLSIPKVDLSPEGVCRAKEAAATAPVVQPPDYLDLTEKEQEILKFTTDAMADVGLQPEFHSLEWAGTDAIALRRHGLSAISLGAGENQPHTRRESIEVEDLVKATELIRALVRKAAAMGHGAAGAALGGVVGATLARA